MTSERARVSARPDIISELADEGPGSIHRMYTSRHAKTERCSALQDIHCYHHRTLYVVDKKINQQDNQKVLPTIKDYFL